MLARPVAASSLRPGDQPQGTVGGHLLQVAANRRRLLPQRHYVRAALLHGHQIGGISAGQPLDHELLDELLDRLRLPGHVLTGPGPVPGRHRAPVHPVPGMRRPPGHHVPARAQGQPAQQRPHPPRRLAGRVLQDAAHRPPRLLRHQRLPLALAHDLPPVHRQPGDPGVQQDAPDAGPVPPGRAAPVPLRRRQLQPGPLPHDPADRPPAQQRRARLRHRRALDRVRGHVVLAVPERARPAGEPLPVDRRRLVGQLLPLGLAFLLGLGHRDQDPGVPAARSRCPGRCSRPPRRTAPRPCRTGGSGTPGPAARG